jgi:hypothetical protein
VQKKKKKRENIMNQSKAHNLPLSLAQMSSIAKTNNSKCRLWKKSTYEIHSRHRASHHTLEYVMSSLQLRNPIDQEFSLAFGGYGLGSNGFGFCVIKAVGSDWREYLLEIADDVALNDLSGDVRNPQLLLDLRDEY